MIAALVFGACGLLAAAAVEYLLRSFADQAGVNRWVFIAVPGLFGMLYALMLFQDGRRRIRQLGQSVSRGILIALLTWLSFSAMATMVWCPARDLASCFGHLLVAAAIVGGGPMLAVALLGGLLAGVLIIRPPAKKLNE
jgi:hypothetical protein